MLLDFHCPATRVSGPEKFGPNSLLFLFLLFSENFPTIFCLHSCGCFMVVSRVDVLGGGLIGKFSRIPSHVYTATIQYGGHGCFLINDRARVDDRRSVGRSSVKMGKDGVLLINHRTQWVGGKWEWVVIFRTAFLGSNERTNGIPGVSSRFVSATAAGIFCLLSRCKCFGFPFLKKKNVLITLVCSQWLARQRSVIEQSTEKRKQ